MGFAAVVNTHHHVTRWYLHTIDHFPFGACFAAWKVLLVLLFVQHHHFQSVHGDAIILVNINIYPDRLQKYKDKLQAIVHSLFSNIIDAAEDLRVSATTPSPYCVKRDDDSAYA